MKSILKLTTTVCSAICLLAPLSSGQDDSAKKKEPMQSYLRIVQEPGKKNSPKSLETSVRTFQSTDPNGVTVDLIGAVHIGEESYYQQLNDVFDSYDVLLYELVAPEGTVVPKGGKRESSNPISFLQDSMKTFLGLESQLEKIDYTKKHFVRADMSPEQIGNKMKERGDTPFTVALGAFTDVLREQNLAALKIKEESENPYEDVGFFDVVDNPLLAKRMMAWQFSESGSLDQSLGKTLNQMLIVDRNAEALRFLQKEIAAGKKKIGIFYGAAHLPDFENHLVKDFGLVAQEPRWIVAWDLTKSGKKPEASPFSKFRQLLNWLE